MRSKAPTFKDFWKAYPLHRGKIDAEKAWNRLSAGDKQKALAGIPRYCEFIEQTGTNIKYPHGWLNGRRWEDEYEATQVSGFKVPVSSGAPQKRNTQQEPETWNLKPETTADTLSDMETW